jgi:hypothetical protein
LEIWKNFKDQIPFEENGPDITAAILVGGLILNRTIKMQMDDIKDLFIKIRDRLE